MLSVLPVESLGSERLSLRVALLNTISWIRAGHVSTCEEVCPEALRLLNKWQCLRWNTDAIQAFARATGNSLNDVQVKHRTLNGTKWQIRTDGTLDTPLHFDSVGKLGYHLLWEFASQVGGR